MPANEEPNLITPDGLHYECTGCGKCCSGWSVPLTEEDYQRIVAIDWESLDANLRNKSLFRPLTAGQKLNTPYTHAINATAEGQCPFLKNNLCFIHSQFGAKTKPAMCQLFPYSFNETPSGIYTSVSFVSRGAIFNAGKALSDQREYLLSKYKDFRNLFVDYLPNWSQIKLSANIPLSWEDYLKIENHLILFLQDKNKRLEDRFVAGCEYLDSLLTERKSALGGESKSGSKGRQSSSTNHEERGQGDMRGTARAPNDSPVGTSGSEGRQGLNRLDQITLVWLYKTYFPGKGDRPQGYGNLTFDMAGILKELIASFFASRTPSAKPNQENAGPYYDSSNFSYCFAQQLLNLPWPDDDMESNDIIYRFFYSHIFGKHYFGAGLGQLSLITGFHHLAILSALIKLHARKLAIGHFNSKVDKMDVVQTIVQLEKSLGELKISGFGAAILEILLASPGRVARIMHFTQ
jgi:Fe-S-cluster containining protein